jgi:hypothetical protein
MKTILHLISIVYLFTSLGYDDNQSRDYLPKSYIENGQYKNILTLLLKCSNFDSLGYALWKPNENNIGNFPLSEDGFCHTNIDTIMYFQSNDSIDNAVVILRTFQFDKVGSKFGSHYEGSPVGVAIFNLINNKWQLDTFKSKLISLGYYVGAEPKYKGILCLQALPSNLMCLVCRQNEACHMNECDGFESAYSLEDKLYNGVELEKFTEIYFNYFPFTSIQSIIIGSNAK